MSGRSGRRRPSAHLGEAREEPLAPGLQRVRVVRADLVEPDHHQAEARLIAVCSASSEGRSEPGKM